MKRNTPMKRGPMKRTPTRRAVPPGFEGLNVKMMDIELPPAPRAYRAGSYGGTTSGIAVPKEPRLEWPHLLLMARNQPRPCLLRVPGLCVATGLTDCCACHGNSHVWNKGGGMKAHDFFSVWGCARCHAWLDSSYSASGEQRDQAFRVALARQIVEWNDIAYSTTAPRIDIVAVRWALDHLLARGYVSNDAAGFHPVFESIHAR